MIQFDLEQSKLFSFFFSASKIEYCNRRIKETEELRESENPSYLLTLLQALETF